jgi:TonB family protein
MKTHPLRLLICVGLMIASVGVAPAQDRRPVARVQVPPAFPYEMSKAGIGGRVVVSFVINQEGTPVDVRVLQATHREFEMPAVQAVLKWRFVPGMKGGKPVAVRVSQTLDFELLGLPAYPAELLRNGVAGRAVVEFSVDDQARAFDVKAVEATDPKFAAAGRAAVMASTLAPALEKSPGVRRRMEFNFQPDGKGDALVLDHTRKFLAMLKKGPVIVKFSELDKPPLRKVHPEPRVAPDVLAAVGPGIARVAVYIDTSGNVILPEVISASHEDFGYAAAQAIRDWKFEVPKKGGKKVPAQGTIEIAFGSR